MSWPLLARVATHLARRKLQGKATRRRHRRILLWRASLVMGALGFLCFTPVLIMLLAVAAVFGGAPATAAAAAVGIPLVVFSAYLAAEAQASTIGPECQVDWPIIAGIWKVESGHATSDGRTIGPDGQVTPPLYGPTLDGSRPGAASTPDTDGGVLDGDPTWDRAVGPAQFLPSSWRSYGRDDNGDGIADPQNVYDAALSTVAYLCLRTPGDYRDPDHLARALLGYNNSSEYVETVSGWINYYRALAFTQGSITADRLYAFPLPIGSVTIDQIRRTHHDYPASDLHVPEGTPVYAAHPGTITALYTPCPGCACGWGLSITGHDNHRYTYCHGSQIASHIQPESTVAAGELIMASGNTGNSAASHLHFQIRNPQGDLVCPQGPLEAWWNGISLSPAGAPTAGCTH
jgi:murein DD-endopeptidase MepM/ murein hydrolase activator NlpD